MGGKDEVKTLERYCRRAGGRGGVGGAGCA